MDFCAVCRHDVDELVSSHARAGPIQHNLAVCKNDESGRNTQDLAKFVGHHDHRGTVFRSYPKPFDNPSGFFRVQARSHLIDDYGARSAVERSGNGHHGPLTKTQRRHEVVRVYMPEANGSQRADCFSCFRPWSHQPARGAKEQILYHRHRLDETKILMYDTERATTIGHRDRARVCDIHPVENLDQRGLAGAVRSEQGHELAPAHGEGDTTQCFGAAESAYQHCRSSALWLIPTQIGSSLPSSSLRSGAIEFGLNYGQSCPTDLKIGRTAGTTTCPRASAVRSCSRTWARGRYCLRCNGST